jgi:four helix bundle protein
MQRHNFKELRIWQLGMDIVDDVYRITANYPKEEQFGLTLQMRKSSCSIPTNISEGCGKSTDPQLIHFLDISQGSAYELETQCYINLRQGYGSAVEINLLLQKISEEQKMIAGFRSGLG